VSTLLNVHSIYHDLNTVHPLPRASIIHLQGCRKGRTDPCPGCANEALWSDEQRWWVDPGELADRVVRFSSTAALSVSGGEPLDQYEPLSLFLRALKSADFSVLLWTGFEMNEVKSSFGKILNWLDYIIVGPYLEHKRVRTVPFVSSCNQEIYCLTARAAKDWVNFDRVGEYEILIPKNHNDAVCLGCDLGA